MLHYVNNSTRKKQKHKTIADINILTRSLWCIKPRYHQQAMEDDRSSNLQQEEDEQGNHLSLSKKRRRKDLWLINVLEEWERMLHHNPEYRAMQASLIYPCTSGHHFDTKSWEKSFPFVRCKHRIIHHPHSASKVSLPYHCRVYFTIKKRPMESTNNNNNNNADNS